MSFMQDETKKIADKVRGVAAEKRLTQQQVADLIGLDRKSVSARYNASIPFSATELWCMSLALGVDIRSFYPSPSSAAPSADDGALSSLVGAA